jgi:hypothetical protein
LNQKNIPIHNIGNQEPFIGLDINEIPPKLEVDDELLSNWSHVIITYAGQYAKFAQSGLGSPPLNQNTIQHMLSNTTKKVEQHQLGPLDPVAVMHAISEKNHQERLLRQQCMHVNTKMFISQVKKFQGNSIFSYIMTNNKNSSGRGSICEKQENNIVIELEEHQQSDDTLPNST